MSAREDADKSLYRKDPKVYPRDVTGTFASLRKLAMFVLMGLYYFIPWINWGGHQSGGGPSLYCSPCRRVRSLS
jgi:hypothetical protein